MLDIHKRIMPGAKGLFVALMLAGCAAVAGCPNDRKIEADTYVPPPHQVGTVAEYARLVGGTLLPVRGYGLVVGLGKDGSTQVPPHLRKYFTKYLRVRKLGSERAGTAHVPPSRVLRDPDTAVVEISGFIPPGAPVGRRFEIQVRAVSGEVRSLSGGVLMPAELRLAAGSGSDPERGSKVFAVVDGSIFVNPFLDESKASDQAKLREGRVVGGGKVRAARAIRLQLLNADYVRARLIQRIVNERFQKPGGPRVANARDSSTIELTVPPAWRTEYEHFLQLVTHLPLRSATGGRERHAMEIGRAMELPTADHEQLSLVWEAMGKEVLPVIGRFYTSRNPYVSYYSARAGLRLGDTAGAPEVVFQAARTARSEAQLEAISELGRHRRLVQATSVLQELLQDKNDVVRVAAYDALRNRGTSSAVASIELGGGNFSLDLVPSRQRYTIYATQTGYPGIVLFGRDMPVIRPVFFTTPRNLVTINANKAGDELTVFRKVGHSGRTSPPFKVDPHVRSLVKRLGTRAVPDEDGNVKGLGLTYGQVVAVLYRMCDEGSIPAKFVLQEPTGLQQFLRTAATVGRPNMPEP